jgi:5-methylcytosine-specific restriction enzyme A
MLKAITKAVEIREAQKKFQGKLYASLPIRQGTYTVGFQGGNIDFDSSLRANSRFWYTHIEAKNEATPRYWNAFGLSDILNLNASIPIVVEINIALIGVPRTIGGLFAVDTANNHTLLLHRGKVGGGKKGIGKEAFLAWCKTKPIPVTHSASAAPHHAVVVADLASPNMVDQLASFIETVAKFKANVREEELSGLPTKKLLEKLANGKKKPKKTAVESTSFERNPYVVEYAKRRAAGFCQLCNERAPFKDSSNRPYLECHHVVWLSDGGIDTIDNAVALCPNCHTRMHVLRLKSDVSKLSDAAKKRI